MPWELDATNDHLVPTIDDEPILVGLVIWAMHIGPLEKPVDVTVTHAFEKRSPDKCCLDSC